MRDMQCSLGSLNWSVVGEGEMVLDVHPEESL